MTFCGAECRHLSRIYWRRVASALILPKTCSPVPNATHKTMAEKNKSGSHRAYRFAS